MICMDVNLKFYFTNVPKVGDAGEKEELEKAFSEVFDELLVDFNEYIRTEAKVESVKEVGE